MCRTAVNIKQLSILLFLCISLLAPVTGAHESSEKVHLLKAGVLVKLAQFIRWKETLPSCNQEDPGKYSIYIYGKTPLESPLVALSKKTKIHKRLISVQRIFDMDSITDCSLVVVGEEKEPELNKLIAASKPKGVIISSATKKFAEKGALINLVIEKGKIKFEINQSTLENSHLSISYKILERAKLVD